MREKRERGEGERRTEGGGREGGRKRGGEEVGRRGAEGQRGNERLPCAGPESTCTYLSTGSNGYYYALGT